MKKTETKSTFVITGPKGLLSISVFYNLFQSLFVKNHSLKFSYSISLKWPISCIESLIFHKIPLQPAQIFRLIAKH